MANKITHSNNNVICQKCEDFLSYADPCIAEWFRQLRTRFSQVHIACSFRNEKDQSIAYNTNRSKLQWPNSKHNFMVDGKPCSKALDLFQLTEEGIAKFDPGFYNRIAQSCADHKDSIRWGGTFKSIHDTDHFELK